MAFQFRDLMASVSLAAEAAEPMCNDKSKYSIASPCCTGHSCTKHECPVPPKRQAAELTALQSQMRRLSSAVP